MSGPANLISAVEQRLGTKAVITDAADIELWLTDWRGRYHGAAVAILAPTSTQEGAMLAAWGSEPQGPSRTSSSQ